MDWSGSGSAAGAHFNFRHGFHLPHSFPRRTTLQSHRFQRVACPRENRRHSEVRVSHRRWHVYHSGRCTCQSCTCRCSTMGCRFANIAASRGFRHLRFRLLPLVLSVRHGADSDCDGRLFARFASCAPAVGRVGEKTRLLGDA